MIDNQTSVTVTIAHVQAAQMCSRGARQWFARHNLNWNQFIEQGLPVETIEGTNDALGQMVADIAREDAGDER